jgi:hypothetical protein
METIKDLNSKWWYRLLKVFYVMALLIAVSVALFELVDSAKPSYDGNLSYIQCDNGKVFILNEWGLLLVGDRLSSYQSDRASQLCTSVTIDGELDTSNQSNSVYEIVVKYHDFNWFSVSIYSLIVIINLVLTFEVARRIFYYIILGSIRPKKE